MDGPQNFLIADHRTGLDFIRTHPPSLFNRFSPSLFLFAVASLCGTARGCSGRCSSGLRRSGAGCLETGAEKIAGRGPLPTVTRLLRAFAPVRSFRAGTRHAVSPLRTTYPPRFHPCPSPSSLFNRFSPFAVSLRSCFPLRHCEIQLLRLSSRLRGFAPSRENIGSPDQVRG